MPSARHQALVRLLTERPEDFVAALQRLTGIRVPDDAVIRQGPETIRSFGYEDYRADGQIIIESRSHPDQSRSVVLEVQLGEDRTKLVVWPIYVVGSRRRLGMKVTLVVVTDSIDVANWASTPIELSHEGSVVVPLVLGPEQIPTHADSDDAHERSMLATLAVVAHGRGPDAERLGRHAIETIRSTFGPESPDAMLYIDVVSVFLDSTVMSTVSEEMMRPQSQEPLRPFAKHLHDLGFQKGIEQGRVETWAKSMLTILAARGIPLSEHARARIDQCDDPVTLERWCRRASVASHVDELFDA